MNEMWRHTGNEGRGLRRPCRHLLCLCLFVMLQSSLFALTSCEYKDLCYDHNHAQDYSAMLQLDLQLDLDLDIDVGIDVETHTEIVTPDYMKVCFYSPDKSNLQSTEFVSGTGGPLHVAPGIYDMVVYSFGTEYIQIRGEGDLETLEAFTSDITATKGATLRGFVKKNRAEGEDEIEEPQGPVIYAPDHLLVAREEVEIPTLSAENRVVTLTAVAKTIVETYSFEVKTVVGTEYIESVEAFVTNQARSSFFGRGEVSTDPATINFLVGVDREKGRLYTAFNTFGKLPGESHSYLHILIRDTGGQEHYISQDITEQFENPDHHIVIEEEIDIPQPESQSSGFAPTVDPWQDEQHDVPIG